METQVTPPAATPLKTDVEFYQELIAALDALPTPELIRGFLLCYTKKLCYHCAIGAMLRKVEAVIPPDKHTHYSYIANVLQCDAMLVHRVMDENDTYMRSDLPDEAQRRSRWLHIRNWAEERIRELTLTEGT